MGMMELFLIAVGLSMDAFAVAVCKGLALRKVNLGQMALVGLWFGGFQALMPLAGYFVGVQFKEQITAIDHWIAFALLAIIGGNMIRESLSKEEECPDASLSVKAMLPMAVATSIDALAVGVSFAFCELRLFKREHRRGGELYRGYHLRVVHGGREGGQPVRRQV